MDSIIRTVTSPKLPKKLKRHYWSLLTKSQSWCIVYCT